MWRLWMSQSCFSLGFLSQYSLWKLSTFFGYKGFLYSGENGMWRVRFFKTELVNGLDSRLGLSRKFQPWGKWMASILFVCSALASMMLQLLACLARVQLLAACKPRATCEIQSRVVVSLHNLEHFFTLSHTLPLHDSHLNIELLIAKIQANLTRNKANKIVD